MQRGGVGWYPHAGSPFVHLDVGSVRSWPRMSHDQLARLFPDGKTVHLPADNRPLPGYELARAEVLARGGTVLGVTQVATVEEDDGPSIKGFFASLFGGGFQDPCAAARSSGAGSGKAHRSRGQRRSGRPVRHARGSGLRRPGRVRCPQRCSSAP